MHGLISIASAVVYPFHLLIFGTDSLWVYFELSDAPHNTIELLDPGT